MSFARECWGLFVPQYEFARHDIHLRASSSSCLRTFFRPFWLSDSHCLTKFHFRMACWRLPSASFTPREAAAWWRNPWHVCFQPLTVTGTRWRFAGTVCALILNLTQGSVSPPTFYSSTLSSCEGIPRGELWTPTGLTRVFLHRSLLGVLLVSSFTPSFATSATSQSSTAKAHPTSDGVLDSTLTDSLVHQVFFSESYSG